MYKEKETVLSRDSRLCTALRCFCGKCTTPTALFAVPNRSLRSRNRLLPKPLATAGDSITICVFDLCLCARARARSGRNFFSAYSLTLFIIFYVSKEKKDKLCNFLFFPAGKKMEHQDQTNQSTDSTMTTQQRRWIVGGRERTRSESGKENSATAATAIRPQARQRRSDRSSMRERSGSEALALAALSASESETPLSTQHRQQLADSPVDFSVPDSALPSDSDHGHWGDQHSSEEELECINGPEHEPCLSMSMSAMPPAAIGIPVEGGGGGGGGNTTALRFGPSAFGPPVTALDKSPRRSQTPQQQLQVCSFFLKTPC